ncbi:hypothetical protein KPHES18087_00470 [Corynebacterium ulcerans]
MQAIGGVAARVSVGTCGSFAVARSIGECIVCSPEVPANNDMSAHAWLGVRAKCVQDHTLILVVDVSHS